MDTIEVQIQKFSYGNVQVLKQIQFTVPEGTFCVLLGQNGAGKSTLLKLMLGEISLDEQGAIRLFGQNVCQFHSWSKISYVPQGGMASYQNFPASVEEIVQANLYTRIGKFRFAGKEEKEMVQQALGTTGTCWGGDGKIFQKTDRKAVRRTAAESTFSKGSCKQTETASFR